MRKQWVITVSREGFMYSYGNVDYRKTLRAGGNDNNRPVNWNWHQKQQLRDEIFGKDK
jgi:hypothetical protein